MKHIYILRIRRWFLFDIYWIFDYSINVIGFTPFKFIFDIYDNSQSMRINSQWHIRKTSQIYSFIGPQKCLNALYVIILWMTYKWTIGFTVISYLNPEILHAKTFCTISNCHIILYFLFFWFMENITDICN